MTQINKIVLNMEEAFLPKTHTVHVVGDEAATVYDGTHVLAVLADGTVVKPAQGEKMIAQNGFCAVKQEGKTGYVPAEAITAQTDKKGKETYKISADQSVFVYDDAAYADTMWEPLAVGTQLQSYQYRGDWWKVAQGDRVGYIRRESVALDNGLFGVPYGNWIIGSLLLVLGALIIIGGIKRIAKFAEIVVPFMAVVYVIGALVIFAMNIGQIGAMLAAIFRFAFRPAAFLGGGIGVLIKVTMTQGFKRGVFSNEAGLGSSVMVHSNSDVKEPVKQGMWGIFEVFFDTFVVCTMTAIVVLSTGYIDLSTGAPAAGTNGDTLVSSAFGQVFGGVGSGFVAIAMLFFAFTTVLGWSQYGSKAVEYLFGEKGVKVYKFIFVAMIVFGAVIDGGLAWDLSDTFNGLMMLPNLIGVVALSPLVMKIVKNYVDRRIKGKKVEPMLSYDPKIQQEQVALLEAEGD
ncbi:MAG: alanine:cation symporter family protein [Ruminococcaceae bacterium]|nr:alanine:cation symporter family protein [Oscillospiraceae bacterium]